MRRPPSVARYGYLLGFLTYMAALGLWPDVMATVSAVALPTLIGIAAILSFTDPRHKAPVYGEPTDPTDPWNIDNL